MSKLKIILCRRERFTFYSALSTIRNCGCAALLLAAALVLMGCIEGPPGPAGIAGVDGIAGADGIDGTDGTDGADGIDGTDGMDGNDGAAGRDGCDAEYVYDGMACVPTASTWTVRTNGTNNGLRGIAYADGTWVGVGNGGTIRTSTNAIDWIASTSGTGNRLNAIAYADGTWVAVADGGTVLTAP